jgi:hypothetical protein
MPSGGLSPWKTSLERAVGCHADASAESFRTSAPAAPVVVSGLLVLPPLGLDETDGGESVDCLESLGGRDPCFVWDFGWREGPGLRTDWVCSAASGVMTAWGRPVTGGILGALVGLTACPALLAPPSLVTREELVASVGRLSL